MIEPTEEQILTEALAHLNARIIVIAEKERFSTLLRGGDVTGRTPEKLHLLRQVEENKSPWQTVRDLDFEPSLPFTPWVDELREEKILKNDDVTIYRLALS